MEKFGIFNLLSMLGSMANNQQSGNFSENQKNNRNAGGENAGNQKAADGDININDKKAFSESAAENPVNNSGADLQQQRCKKAEANDVRQKKADLAPVCDIIKKHDKLSKEIDLKNKITK